MNTGMVIAAVCMCCLCLFFSCTYGTTDEDWDKLGRIRVSLDWQGRPHPSRMDYYFYKDGTGIPIVRRGNGTEYQGTLPSGNYQVVVCNSNCRNILLETENGYKGAYGQAQQVSVVKSLPVCVIGPGNLYGSGCESVGVGGEVPVAKELYPVSLVRTLELHIKITGKGEGKITLSDLHGQVTGVSSQVYLPTGVASSGTPAFMAFEPECMGEGSYRALLTMFGLSDATADNTGGRQTAGIYLTLKGEDGKELTTYVDIPSEVGDIFRQKTSARVTLDLIVAYDQLNGFSVSLEDWNEGTGEAGLDDGQIG